MAGRRSERSASHLLFEIQRQLLHDSLSLYFFDFSTFYLVPAAIVDLVFYREERCDDLMCLTLRFITPCLISFMGEPCLVLMDEPCLVPMA